MSIVDAQGAVVASYAYALYSNLIGDNHTEIAIITGSFWEQNTPLKTARFSIVANIPPQSPDSIIYRAVIMIPKSAGSLARILFFLPAKVF